MKVKFFYSGGKGTPSGSGPQADLLGLEEEINQWLDDDPEMVIVQRCQDVAMSSGAVRVVVSIWYTYPSKLEDYEPGDQSDLWGG